MLQAWLVSALLLYLQPTRRDSFAGLQIWKVTCLSDALLLSMSMMHVDDTGLLQLLRCGFAHAHTAQGISCASPPKPMHGRVLLCLRLRLVACLLLGFPFSTAHTIAWVGKWQYVSKIGQLSVS